MRYFLYLLLTICSILFFYSCSTESDASDVQVMVTPDSLVLHAETEDIIPFVVKLKALKEPLSRLQITQRTTKTGLTILLDTAINFQKFNYDFQYTVPKNIYEKEIELSFIAKTASDYSVSTKHIFLDSVGTPLKESSAHVMYSAKVQINNAFSITRRQVISFPLDSLLSDIYDFHDGLTDASQLSGEWRSATEKRFSRFNDFNYAEATEQSLQTCYANASKKTTISDLKVNDIIMIGNLNTAIAVIKIIAIFDEDGYMDDRYVFNVKYMD
ncbi:MAG: hypothetical protein Q8904_12580 [Bacteroidota bacterium]|nr:hypothetical protein [Bacteroidota bacterium]